MAADAKIADYWCKRQAQDATDERALLLSMAILGKTGVREPVCLQGADHPSPLPMRIVHLEEPQMKKVGLCIIYGFGLGFGRLIKIP